MTLDEENYRPVSFLSHVFLKVLKRRKDLNRRFCERQIMKTFYQDYLMRMIERWKETLNKVGYVCVIFMDTLCTSGCNLEYILKTNKVLL